MPLEELDITGTLVSDLTPLEGMTIPKFKFSPERITKGRESSGRMSLP